MRPYNMSYLSYRFYFMYCTLDDIKKLIPGDNILQLTDDDGMQAIDEPKVDECIQQADGEINPYLISGDYDVPISPVPDLIKKLSVDIAIYNLYSRNISEVIPDMRVKRYDDAVKTLQKIADGKIKLNINIGSGDFATGVVTTSHFE